MGRTFDRCWCSAVDVGWGVSNRQASADRRREAAAALAAVSSDLSSVRVLAVHCANGHHVADVYRTEAGSVVQAATGRRSHGHRDRVDTPHRGAGRAEKWVDLLEAAPFADDTVPGWCDCGPWTLSRRELAQWIDDDERRVVLESQA